MSYSEWDSTWTSAVTAGAASVMGTGLAVRLARRRDLYDVPNERSSHTTPTPRIGGFGLSLGVLVALVTAFEGGIAALPLSFACILGLYDDRHPLRPSGKMFGLVLVALIPAAYGIARLDGISGVPYAGKIGFAAAAVPLSLFWLACYPNAFNFMDGLNGIASLTAAVSAATFVVAGARVHDWTLQAWGAAAAGASLGFLPWNFPNARTFMGDGGSLPLGLLLAMCAVQAEVAHALPFPASVLLLGPFLFDVTFTLIRRAVEGKTIGAPHKEHLYQRLSRVWGSHAKVSLLYAGFSCATGALALAYASMSDVGKLLSLVLPTAAMLGFAALVLRAERTKGP